MEIDRREFLRRAGLGSIAIASLPTLVNSLARPAWAKSSVNYHFMCLSFAGAPGTPAAPQDVMIMAGQGGFDPSATAGPVDGGGFWVHYKTPGANPPAGGPPLPVVASGTWGAGRLVGYKQIGTFGVQAAGILEMVVDLFVEVPAKRTIRGAVLKVVCSIGPAGLVNPGEREGFTLSIPGTDFSAGGTPGPFVPFGPTGAAPGIGVTGFSVFPIPR